MKKETKAILGILIHEVQDILKETTEPATAKVIKIGALLDSWVSANDLHPERVETLSAEEARERGFEV